MRTKRRMCEMLIAGTLVMCAAAIICWRRGYQVSEGVGVWVRGHGVHAASFRGGFEIALGVDTRHARPNLDVGYGSVPRAFAEAQWEPKRPQVEARRMEIAGFVLALGRPDMTYAHNGVWVPMRVVVPAWFVVGVLLLTLIVLRRARRGIIRRERLAAGLCGQCGYDMRATPGRCPECGTSARLMRWLRQLITTGDARVLASRAVA